MDDLGGYIPAKQAAIAIGIEYSTLMARIRKKKIKSKKAGWSTFVHKDEVKRAKQVEDKKNANNKNMERATR